MSRESGKSRMSHVGYDALCRAVGIHPDLVSDLHVRKPPLKC